jgi:tetratricopeptide (TPR) repeat protein
MKTKLAKRYISLFLLLVFSCEPRSSKLYNEAYEKIGENRYLEAIDLLESSAALEKDDLKKTKALFEAARLLRFEILDFNKAIIHLKKIVLQSTDEKSRLLSQEAIADIYFDNVQNYSQALKELLVLEPLVADKEKKESVRFKIAKCQHLTGNSKTALEYIESLIKSLEFQKRHFLLLKAQILQAQERFEEALLVYNEIEQLDPEFFKKESLYSSISLVLEEKQDYAKGIEFLERNRQNFVDQSYWELRMKRLKEKQLNKPFSRGMRK